MSSSVGEYIRGHFTQVTEELSQQTFSRLMIPWMPEGKGRRRRYDVHPALAACSNACRYEVQISLVNLRSAGRREQPGQKLPGVTVGHEREMST